MFEQKLIGNLRNFNRLLHVFLSIALAVASLMVVWEFVFRAFTAVQEGKIAQGFLEALGTLFILWTLSSLIAAEINYIQSSKFHVRVFVEVAMITVLREIIVRPVEVVTGGEAAGAEFNPVHYGLLLAALLIIGVVHKLVGNLDSDDGPQSSA